MAENTALKTVADYLSATRTLLQDKIAPYRYPDTDLVDALNIGIQEAYRLRPELFMSGANFSVPGYSASTPSDPVLIDIGYRQSLVYYMVGRTQLADQEDTTDQRAGALLQKFMGQMLTIAS